MCCFHKSRRSAAGCLDCYGHYKGAVDTGGSSAEGMLITTEEQFYASVEFLSMLSGQLFESRRNQMIAQKAVEKSSVSELAMEYQLHRSRAMTEICR